MIVSSSHKHEAYCYLMRLVVNLQLAKWSTCIQSITRSIYRTYP